MQNKKDWNNNKRERPADEYHNDSIPVLENEKEDKDKLRDVGWYDYSRSKGKTNLTVKKEKHCGILKEKPPLDEDWVADGVEGVDAQQSSDQCNTNDDQCNTNDDQCNANDKDNFNNANDKDNFNNTNDKDNNTINYNNTINQNNLAPSFISGVIKPSLAVKILKFYGINLIGCSLCRDGVSCSEGSEIKFSSECCCIKEIETIFGILKLRRIFKDKTFNEHGYKYKTELQIRMLNEIMRITPYPNSQTLENLAVLLNLKPRSVQIWFQNARQGGDIQFSKDRLKGLRKSASIDIRVILEIFVKVCYGDE